MSRVVWNAYRDERECLRVVAVDGKYEIRSFVPALDAWAAIGMRWLDKDAALTRARSIMRQRDQAARS